MNKAWVVGRYTVCCGAMVLVTLTSSLRAIAQDWIYPIQESDTPWSICLEYTNKPGCWIELSKYNDIDRKLDRDRRIPVGTEIRIPIDWLVRVPEVGTVVSLQGSVSYESGVGQPAVPLLEGQSLLLGSRIVSGTGTASLRLVDGSELLLRPGVTLELNSMSTSSGPRSAAELSLDEGELDVKVPTGRDTRFEVQTPSAIAAVRGTAYRLAALDEGGATRGEVVSGAVAVRAATEQRVEAGFGVLAKKGEPVSEPRKLLDPPAIETGSERGALPLTLRWGADPEAVAWQIDLYGPGGSPVPLETRQIDQAEATFAALDLSCYRAVVLAVDADGFKGMPTETSLCAEPAPPPEPEEYVPLLPYLL